VYLTGISEILILILLIACILILPRLLKGESASKSISPVQTINKLSAKKRLGIVLSVAYPTIFALIFKPWQGNLIPYISIGVAPVILVWSFIWIIAGKKKQ
jgi:hypothetical protein